MYDYAVWLRISSTLGTLGIIAILLAIIIRCWPSFSSFRPNGGENEQIRQIPSRRMQF